MLLSNSIDMMKNLPQAQFAISINFVIFCAAYGAERLIIFGLVFNIYSTILSSLFRKLLRFLHQSLPRVSCDTEDYVLIVTTNLKVAGSRVAQNIIKNSKGASRLSYIPVRFHEIFLKNSHVLRLIRKLKKFSR